MIKRKLSLLIIIINIFFTVPIFAKNYYSTRVFSLSKEAYWLIEDDETDFFNLSLAKKDINNFAFINTNFEEDNDFGSVGFVTDLKKGYLGLLVQTDYEKAVSNLKVNYYINDWFYGYEFNGSENITKYNSTRKDTLYDDPEHVPDDIVIEEPYLKFREVKGEQATKNQKHSIIVGKNFYQENIARSIKLKFSLNSSKKNIDYEKHTLEDMDPDNDGIYPGYYDDEYKVLDESIKGNFDPDQYSISVNYKSRKIKSDSYSKIFWLEASLFKSKASDYDIDWDYNNYSEYYSYHDSLEIENTIINGKGKEYEANGYTISGGVGRDLRFLKRFTFSLGLGVITKLQNTDKYFSNDEEEILLQEKSFSMELIIPTVLECKLLESLSLQLGNTLDFDGQSVKRRTNKDIISNIDFDLRMYHATNMGIEYGLKSYTFNLGYANDNKSKTFLQFSLKYKF